MADWRGQRRRWAVAPEGVAVRWAAQLVHRLSRRAVSGRDNLRPHTGAFVATIVYLVAVYLIGRR